MPHIFYVSMCGPMVGYCMKVYASQEHDVRVWAKENMGRLWCSVYEDTKGMTVIGESIYI